MAVSHFSNSPSPALLPLIRQIRQGRVNKGEIFFFQSEVGNYVVVAERNLPTTPHKLFKKVLAQESLAGWLGQDH